VPACMRIFSRKLFWPGLTDEPRREAFTTRVGAAVRAGVARGTSRRLIAWPTVAVVGAALVVASTGIAYMHLALTPIRGLEGKTAVGTAASDAAQGFTPGIVAPTAVILRGDGVGRDRDALRRFARDLVRRPEVGAVIGAETPVQIPHQYRAVFLRPNAVRYFVAFVHHPYSSEAIADLRHLEEAMPSLLERAGVRAEPTYAGDTALAKVTVERVHRDLLWVGLAAAAVNFVLLALFLRSLIAPLLLVASSALAIAATFGVTAYVFRDVVGSGDFTYFVPLAVGVLLLSFGTDYNLFVVGHIWQHARKMPLTEAIRTAVPRASRAISIAGVALACSFAMLAIVPIAPFREFAVAVGVGVIVDTFIVRTLLIPALLAALGDWSWWPRRPSFAEGERGAELEA
jgi:putative drug exporter of the RND superfamily